MYKRQLFALFGGIWLNSRAFDSWGSSEMFVSFSVSVWSKKKSVGSSWVLEDELIKGIDLSSVSENSLSGSLGDSESADLDLWDFEESKVISDGSDDNSDLMLFSLNMGCESLERHWTLVGVRELQSSEDSLGEV